MFSALACPHREAQQGEEEGGGGGATGGPCTQSVSLLHWGFSNEYIVICVISVISNRIATVQSAHNPIKPHKATAGTSTGPPEATRRQNKSTPVDCQGIVCFTG